MSKRKASDYPGLQPQTAQEQERYEARVRRYEDEGCDRSDAQAIVEGEDLKAWLEEIKQ